ncbi:M48 family metallopeptidase [Streptomyces antimicrobicus]|uniref:M48 family metallopeptidase n=1 Tax=Streptomyces antimicrobicus TaxID=2883108 RepID=A0ABS8B2F4_9ACTN|nr:M48 family metallopeptidase [Streptomyces antimicrobicus]MCB5178775.1 M48 family metallopeptidase [Streptomyces antimicrobicus]
MEHDLAAGPVQGQLCPECGEALTATDERFVVWCAACDWNVDPGAAEPEPGRLAAFRRRLARRHGEQLAAETAGGDPGRPRRDASALLALALALAVHGVTLALAVAGLLLIVLGWGTAVQPVEGLVLLVVAVVLRPRLGRLPQHGPVLHRADAPRLFELIDEVAAVTGTAGVHAVVVDGTVNAAVTAYGPRRRRVLTLGLGLWEVLGPRERVALLGHELGHFAHGDVRHGLVVHGALRSLLLWLRTLAPSPGHTVWDSLFNAVAFLPRCATYALLVLLDRLTLRAAQRAEYQADRSAARAGSTEGAVALMDRLLVAESIEAELRRESVAAQMTGGKGGRAAREAAEQGLWERIAAHAASVPGHERERLSRVAARRGHSVDDTHPPTHLRRQCLSLGDPLPAQVTYDEHRAAAVTAELAAARAAVARRIIRERAG